MNNKKYEAPSLEELEINVEDIMVASDGNSEVIPGEGGTDDKELWS